MDSSTGCLGVPQLEGTPRCPPRDTGEKDCGQPTSSPMMTMMFGFFSCPAALESVAASPKAVAPAVAKRLSIRPRGRRRAAAAPTISDRAIFLVEIGSSGRSLSLVERGRLSRLNGLVSGGNGTLELASGAGSGSISGLNTGSFQNFSALVVDAGASWSLSGSNTIASVTDNGSLIVTSALPAANYQIGVAGGGGTLEVASAPGNASPINFLGNSTLIIDNAATFGACVHVVEVPDVGIVRLNSILPADAPARVPQHPATSERQSFLGARVISATEACIGASRPQGPPKRDYASTRKFVEYANCGNSAELHQRARRDSPKIAYTDLA